MKPDEATFVFGQDGDDNDSNDYQRLSVIIDNAGAGPYVVLSTPRWAMDVDDIARFAQTLKDLVKQVKSDEEKMQQPVAK